MPVEEWKKFLDSTSKYTYKIIGGDVNAHNTHWGSRVNCSSGTILLEAIEEQDILIVNDGLVTYQKNDETHPVTSAIDVTMVSSNLHLATI